MALDPFCLPHGVGLAAVPVNVIENPLFVIYLQLESMRQVHVKKNYKNICLSLC